MTQKQFHSNFAHFNCPNCGCDIQALLHDADGQPVDIDWNSLQEIYANHNNACSAANPFTDDPNVIYGDISQCYPSTYNVEACVYPLQ